MGGILNSFSTTHIQSPFFLKRLGDKLDSLLMKPRKKSIFSSGATANVRDASSVSSSVASLVILHTGCPGKFGIAKMAGVTKMLGSAVNLGTQGGYTMVPQTPNVPSQKKFPF